MSKVKLIVSLKLRATTIQLTSMTIPAVRNVLINCKKEENRLKKNSGCTQEHPKASESPQDDPRRQL